MVTSYAVINDNVIMNMGELSCIERAWENQTPILTESIEFPTKKLKDIVVFVR